MTTKIDIANAALVLIGEDPVSSFDGAGTAQVALRALYESKVKACLARFPWSFATGEKTLSRLAGTPTSGYSAAYQIPLDPEPLRLIRLKVNGRLADYRRFEDAVHVDAEASDTVVLTYIWRALEIDFTPEFVEALQYELASDLAIPVGENDGLMESHGRTASIRWAIARNTSSQQHTAPRHATSRFLAARRGAK